MHVAPYISSLPLSHHPPLPLPHASPFHRLVTVIVSGDFNYSLKQMTFVTRDVSLLYKLMFFLRSYFLQGAQMLQETRMLFEIP